MRKEILIGIIVLLPLLSLANAAFFDGITCATLHIGCTSNTIAVNATVPVSNSSTNSISTNTSIVTNSLDGTIKQTYFNSQQYDYQIILPKSLMNGSGIFTFYLLGTYNGNLGFQYPAKVSCTTTNQINCTAIFIVTLGSFDRLEIIRNGMWLYALKLPASIVTKNVQAVTIVTPKQNNNLEYLLLVLGIIAAVMLSGNIAYDRYRIKQNPNAYIEVNP